MCIIKFIYLRITATLHVMKTLHLIMQIFFNTLLHWVLRYVLLIIPARERIFLWVFVAKQQLTGCFT